MRTISKGLLYLIIFISTTVYSFSQVRIDGKAMDKKKNTGVSLAEIFLELNGRVIDIIKADSSGSFVFQDVVPGKYSLKVRHKEYNPVFKNLEVLNGSPVFVEIEMLLAGVLDPPVKNEKQPLAYSHVREADVMWSKRIWRVIPLSEKINLPFKFPLHNQTNDRKNLIDVIFDAAIAGDLAVYYGEHGEEFAEKYTLQEIKNYGVSHDTIEVIQPDGSITKEVSHREFNRDDVIKYRIKEDWFFDKQRSVMEVRIIGIAPVVEDTVRNIEIVPFWIYFPEARPVFAANESFNRFNDAERRTFDDIFIKRMFNSYIIKESNVEDRRIKDYSSGLDALLESQRIKEDLFNLESDVWEN